MTHSRDTERWDRLNRSLLPSGDQATRSTPGPQSLQEYTSSSPLPFAFITTMLVVEGGPPMIGPFRMNAIRRPSGDQLGLDSKEEGWVSG